MTPVIVRSAAEADIEDAFHWYEEQRAGLGDAFREAMKAAFNVIAKDPLLFRVLHRDTRRYLVRRFPYAIYYRVFPDSIVIVACMHCRRNPKRWLARN
ncbi:MAG: type II toxin-antitoxin system RelE/ParE family toxin [Betaproteobacteria bacterium]|nr:type II toxin-antitoxin system RelE/ParE family toxin [Betaproteobacteria bacterium]